MEKWYRLDNAAKIFPAVTKTNNTSTFRVAVLLKELVDPTVLAEAAQITLEKFPMFRVRLRHGFFWNYFTENNKEFTIEEETEYPCYPMKATKNNGYLLRILYYHRRISVEFFHSLTDGFGAFVFLKALLIEYMRLTKGILVPPSELPDLESLTEDSFLKNYKSMDHFSLPKDKKSYRIKGSEYPFYGNAVIHGVVDANMINTVAKKKGVTLTVYLVTLLILSVYKSAIQYHENHPFIVIALPVNLRQIFPSQTLRNFFTVINIGITFDQDYSFDECLEQVVKQFDQFLKKEHLQKIIAMNVKLEKNPFVKAFPLFIKDWALQYGFQNFGETKKTITLTNLGRIDLPQEIGQEVDQMEVLPYPTVKSPVNCGMCTMNDKLNISFIRSIEETDIIMNFFRLLYQLTNLEIYVYTNHWGNIYERM